MRPGGKYLDVQRPSLPSKIHEPLTDGRQDCRHQDTLCLGEQVEDLLPDIPFNSQSAFESFDREDDRANNEVERQDCVYPERDEVKPSFALRSIA